MKAYVAMRGTSKQRVATRDAGQGHFASLVVGHANGDATVYELSFQGSLVAVTVKYPGKEVRDLVIDDGFLDFEPIPQTAPEPVKDGAK